MFSLLLADVRNIVITVLLAALVVMFFALKIERAELLQTKVSIETMKAEAEKYETDSKRIANEIGSAHAAMVEQVEKNAYERAKRRFGTVARCPAVGIGTRGVLPTQHGDGQADSASGTDEVPTEERVAFDREHVEDYAICIGNIFLWQDWARRNQLIPVTD